MSSAAASSSPPEQQQQQQQRCSFSGKWELDSAKTEGDVDSCMVLLGRERMEIGYLKKASEVQLFQQYNVDGIYAMHKHVHYHFLIHNFRYETCLRFGNERQVHKPDHKKFGDCTTKSKWKTNNSYEVRWSMIVKGVDTTMRITRTLENENLTSVHMLIKQKGGGKSEAECKKYYRRAHRNDKERATMDKMCEGREQYVE